MKTLKISMILNKSIFDKTLKKKGSVWRFPWRRYYVLEKKEEQVKVTLLGDSIRQQYEHRVRELLGDTFDVWAPRENCRFSQYTLRGLFDWAEHMDGSEIVHWNNGYWDVCRLFGDGTFSDEDDYVKNMLRIIDVLQKKHCLVIFATTTPVRSANMYNKNEDIDRFNRRIVPLLRARCDRQ